MTINPVDAFVGERLKVRRRKLSFSQQFLAEKLGISHQLVQKYEKGETRLPASTLYAIGLVLGVPTNYFFEGFDANLKTCNVPGANDVIQQDIKRPLNILLIEDDAADELITRKSLNDIDADVTIYTLRDGVEALDFLRNYDIKGAASTPFPDIILLDLNIPKKNGHVFLKELKQDHNLRYLPVIVVTNSISMIEMVDSYKLYASGYICKSFDYETYKRNMLNLVNYWYETVALPEVQAA